MAGARMRVPVPVRETGVRLLMRVLELVRCADTHTHKHTHVHARPAHAPPGTRTRTRGGQKRKSPSTVML